MIDLSFTKIREEIFAIQLGVVDGTVSLSVSIVVAELNSRKSVVKSTKTIKKSDLKN